MTSITTRAGKGTPLTHTEVDDNFTNLNADKLEASNNLSDVSSTSAARTNLGLGTAATTASTDYATAAQGSLADSAVQPDDDVSLGAVTADGLTVDGKIAAGDELGNANLSNTLDYTSSAGVAGYRPINLIDSSAGVKISRPNDDGNGAFIEFQEWDSTITTLISRAMLTGEGGDLLYRNLTTGGGDHIFQGEANAEHMRITSTGSVGIGTSSPSQLLHLSKSGIAGMRIEDTDAAGGYVDLKVNGSAFFIDSHDEDGTEGLVVFRTAGTETMRITSAGDVGIGTNSPATALDVVGTVTADRLTVSNTVANLYLEDSNDPNNAYVRIYSFGGVGIIDVDPNSNGGVASSFRVAVDGTETMRIDSSGNVGIGTSSPDAPLMVHKAYASNRGQLEIRDTSVGAASYPYMSFYDDADDRQGIVGSFAGNMLVYSDTGQIRMSTGGSEAMRIDSSGNVGIGTSSPSERLSVTGNATISGSLSKGSGSFKIDHPVKPDTHHLVHSFIEGPQADNLYRGKVALVDGSATVNLDEAGRMTEGTFVALNGNVQCFTSNESGWSQVRGAVSGNTLTIVSQDAGCTDEVSWLVIGERHDTHMLDTEWTDENGRVITEPLKG